MKISPVSTLTTMSLLLLALSATFDAVVALSNTTTVWVSNQKRAVAGSIIVICTEGLVQQPINKIKAGQEIGIRVRAQRGPNGFGSFCVGRDSLIDGMEEKVYNIYDTRQGGKDFSTNGNCGSNGCRVKANDTSFYRWNDGSHDWEIVYPRTWLP